MTKMDDAWVEVPAIHEPIPQTRFEKKEASPLRGIKRLRAELQRPIYLVPHSLSSFSLSVGFHKVEVLPGAL